MNDLINFFKILCDETRLRLLVLLYTQDFCVCELTDILKISQPKVSRHLSKLRDLGFVETRKDARFVYYHLSIDHPVIKDILKVMNEKISQFPCLLKDSENIAQCRRDGKLSINT